MAKFNLAALDLEGGRRWFDALILYQDARLDPYQRSILKDAARSRELTDGGIIFANDRAIPIREFLPMLLGRTPQVLLDGYEGVALAARRFANSPDEYLEYDTRRFESLKRAPVHEPPALVDFGMSRLEGNQERVRVLRVGPDFIDSAFAMMKEVADASGSAFPLMEAAQPTRGTSHRVGLLNERLGFLVMARGGGTLRMWEEALREAVDDAFGGYRIDATPVEMSYSAKDDILKVSLLPKDPATAPFEGHATDIVVSQIGKGGMGQVEVIVGREPRPADEPLIFQYRNGSGRPGWPKVEEVLYRAEAKYGGDRSPNGTITVMAALAATMRAVEAGGLYLVGDRTVYDLADLHEDEFMKAGAEILHNRRIDILGFGEEARQIVAGAWDAIEGHSDRRMDGGGGEPPASGGAAAGGSAASASGGSGGADASFSGAIRHGAAGSPASSVEAGFGFGFGSAETICSAFDVVAVPEMYKVELALPALGFLIG